MLFSETQSATDSKTKTQKEQYKNTIINNNQWTEF